MTQKVEFASPEWMVALREMIEFCVKEIGPDVSFSLCEVFTSVPAHLDRSGNGAIAWHCIIRNGVVDFDYGEIDNADIKTIADYAYILPFARTKIEASNMDAYKEEQEEGVRSGKVTHFGDRSKIPAAFYGMHNELAEITA